MLKRLALMGLAAVIVLPLAATPQDESFGDRIRQLLQEGTDLYKRGKFEEAASKFEEAFQMKPNSDKVYAYIQRAGEALVAGMMNSTDRKMQDVGRRLFEMSKPGIAIRKSKTVVLKYIEDLKSDSYAVWKNAYWHLKNFGPWAVRFILPGLADQQQDRFRARIVLLLTDMNTDSSLAVIEALNSSDSFLRQQAAIVLGNVKDERAIPRLRQLTEDPNEPAAVRKFALEALNKIIRVKSISQLKRSTDYYYELAMKYYYSHSSVILYWERAFLIWKWDTEKNVLTERKVARMAYNEQLAEETLYDLLKLDPDYVQPERPGYSAWSLLANVHFAEALESKAAVMAAVEALKVGELDREGLLELILDTEGMTAESATGLAGQIQGAGDAVAVRGVLLEYYESKAKMIRANVLAELPGKEHLYEALARSLDDGNALVAKAAIDVIGQMGLPGDLPAVRSRPSPDGQSVPVAGVGNAPNVSSKIGAPLIAALAYDDKRVRYAAANAMVAINPQRLKLGMELVIPNLVDALGEQGVRVALVIYDVQSEEDYNFRNAFRKMLVNVNMFPVFVNNGSEGVVRAKQFPTEDVIIIQKKIAPQTYFREADTSKQIVESVFDTLRDDVRTKHIPRIILGDSRQEEDDARREYLENGTAHGVIGKGVHKLDLQAMMEKIFDLPEAKKDAKDRADLISKEAATTLATIDPTNTLYPFRDAVPALIQTVKPEILREDFIRVPAADALGNFGDQRGLDVLAKVVADKDDARAASQKAIRWECSKSLSKIFRVTQIAPAKEVYEVMMKYLKDGDYDIEFNCGEALGNSVLTSLQRLEVSKARRIVRETITAADP